MRSTARPPAGEALEERAIRVFVSSTFRDMQAERDELVLRVFPELRKRCRERGVIWGEVDLRWGVTDEQSAEGKVLPLCLAEIRRCRPYFIGLLGERYGWVPDDIPDELIEQEPWLAEHRERSITELEIIHGVLADPGMSDHAFFYFRDPTYIDSLPSQLRPHFSEIPTPDEVERFGADEAQKRADTRRRKLRDLKCRIRRSGCRCSSGYSSPQELGKQVLRDLTELIDRIFQTPPPQDPLDREAAAHEALARTYTPTRTRPGVFSGVYIARQACYSRLDDHVLDQGLPLVVTGEPGAGKTALLANWVRRHQSAHPDSLVIAHYVGASPRSTDWEALLRRLMGELGRGLHINVQPPKEPDALKIAFANSLHVAAHSGRAVIVIDGLGQLEDRGGAPDLAWLPPEIPENIRLILSTGPGRPHDELKRRRWPALRVAPLAEGERARLIKEYLRQYSKRLAWSRMKRIAKTPQTANPLYLCALLEELRVFGIYEELDQRIDRYLAQSTIQELYGEILNRLQEDYERDRPNLVRDAMRHLWAARRGLSEAELLDLLGKDGKPLPSAHWSPLWLATERSLINRSGMIGLSHEAFRRAVQDRYVATPDAQRAAHQALAAHFSDHELSDRKVDELPWQLAEARDCSRLYGMLSDPTFFDAAWNWDEFDVKRYWTRIEKSTDMQMRDAYRGIIESPERLPDPELARHLAMLHGDTGHLDEARILWTYLADCYERSGERGKHARALTNLGGILRVRGQPNKALNMHRQAERICRELGDTENLHRALGNQALVLRDIEQLKEALEKHKEEEAICRDRRDLNELSICLGHKGVILYLLGDLKRAMEVLEEQERICRALGNANGLVRILEYAALIAMAHEDLDGAMESLVEQEKLARSLGNWRALQSALGNQGMILHGKRDPDLALARFRDQEAICRRVGDTRALAQCLRKKAVALPLCGEIEEALVTLAEGITLANQLQDLAMKAQFLASRAALLAERGRLQEALSDIKEAEPIVERLKSPELRKYVSRIRGEIASHLHDRNGSK